MGYIKIWVHLVWSTKNRQPLLDPDIRKQVFEHMRENANISTVLKNLFRAKAQLLFGYLKPRTEGPG